MDYSNNVGRGKNFSGAQRETVNTNGLIFKNPEARKYMNVTYWDACIGIEIGILSPEAQQDFRNASAPKVRQVFSFFDIANLLDVCEEIRDSIKESGQFSSAGVRVGSMKNNIIMISNGSDIGQPEGIYLVVYKNIDPSGRTNEIEFYPFQSRAVIRGYDITTGAIREDKNKLREFKDFVIIVREAAKAFTNAQAHVMKKAQHADTLSSLKLLSAIAMKNGVDPMELSMKATSSGSDSYQKPGGYNRSNGWGGNNNGYQSNRYGNQPKFSVAGRSAPFENGVPDMNVDINLDASQLNDVPF